jgi:hypothetical protein
MTKKLRLLVAIGMTLGSLASVQGQSFLTNGLVAYYPFNGNANDGSGNGRHGTVSGPQLATGRDGLAQSAYSFNGTNDFISLPSIALTGNVARTFTVWVRTVKPQQCYISTGQPTTAASFNLVQYPFAHVGLMGYNYDYYPDSGVVVNDGNWHSIAATYDGLNLSLFVDGNLQSKTNMGSYRTIGEQNYLGKSSHSCCQNFFGGVMDDVRIYSRALSSNEVASLYYYESKKNVQLVKMYTLDYDGLAIGTNYQLQVSTNLVSWTNWGSVFTATSVKYTNTVPIQRVDDWGKIFFRLDPK